MKSVKKLIINVLLFINLGIAGFGSLYTVIQLWSSEVILKSKLAAAPDERLSEAYAHVAQSRGLILVIGIITVCLTLICYFILNFKRKPKTEEKEKPIEDIETEQE